MILLDGKSTATELKKELSKEASLVKLKKADLPTLLPYWLAIAGHRKRISPVKLKHARK